METNVWTTVSSNLPTKGKVFARGLDYHREPHMCKKQEDQLAGH